MPYGISFVFHCWLLQLLNSVPGGSLLSIGSLENKKSLKKLAKNLGKFWDGIGM
jgi:hypothetical protein